MMARLPRLTLAGYPHHVIQRGNNRQAIFVTVADYQYLLGLSEENANITKDLAPFLFGFSFLFWATQRPIVRWD